MQVGAIAGPAIGGYAYAWTPSAAYFLSAALFGIALACLFLVTRVPRNIAVRRAHPLRQIADGPGYVGQNQPVLAPITPRLFAVLPTATNARLPRYAPALHHVSPSGVRPRGRRVGT